MAEDFKDIEQKVKVTIETNADTVAKSTDDVATNTEKIAENTKKVTKATKENTDANKELSSSLDNISGGSITAFNSLKEGLSNGVKGFKTLRGAIIATGLGALVVVIASITAAFTSSEEGQNKFAKLMAVIGSVTGNLTDLLSDLGEVLISVFENPQKAIKAFANAIKDNIVNRLNGLLELIPKLGKAVSLLFEGKFSEAAKVAADATAKVTLGVTDLTSKIQGATKATQGLIAEMQREANIAADIADKRAKSDKLERDLIVGKAEAERKRAELLDNAQKRDQFSQKERIQFLKEAGKLDEDITKKQIDAARLRRDAIIEENKLSKSNKEALEAEEEAKAELIRLETARLSRQKEVTGQIQGLQEQELAEAKAKTAAKKALLDKEKADREAFLKSIQDLEDSYNKSIEDLNDKTEELKLERQKERDLELIENLRKQGADVQDLLRLNTEKYNILEDELIAKREEEKKALDQKRIDDRRAFDEQFYTGIKEFADARNEEEIETVRAHKEALAEIDRELAERKIEEEGGTEEEVAEKKAELAEYYRQQEVENTIAADTAILEHKLNTFDQIASAQQASVDIAKMLFQKNKGVQKGLLIAENAVGLAKVGINTATGISKAMSKGLPGIPEAIAVGASGALSAVKLIAATKKGLQALGGGGSAGGGGDVQQAPTGGQAPQVDFQNSSENQIGRTVANAQQELPPTRAYVVSAEVTNSQQIERNRAEGNSF